jgi:acetyl-CoA C-acetyltransferase
MGEAYIIDATRTPTGKRRGSLQDIHGADLGAHVIKEIVERNAIPEAEYDDVIFGCLDAVGPLAGNIARTAWLVAGYDLTVPGVTIDRQCGSNSAETFRG